MKPIHTLTIIEYNILTFNEKLLYPDFSTVKWYTHKGYFNYHLCVHPSSSNYYLLALVYHIKQGGRIVKRIWDALNKEEKTEVLTNIERIDLNTIKVESFDNSSIRGK